MNPLRGASMDAFGHTVAVLLCCLTGTVALATAVVRLGPSPLVLPLFVLWVVVLAPRRHWCIPILILSLLLVHFVLAVSVVVAGVHFFVSDLILIGLIAAVSMSTKRPEGSPVRVGRALHWLMIAFYADLILSAVVGLMHGHDLKTVVNGTKELLFLSVFFLVPRLLRTTADIHRLLAILLGGTGAAALYDVFNRLTGIGYFPYNASSIEVTLTTGTVSRAYGLITAPTFYLIATIFTLALLALVPMKRSRQHLGLAYSTLIIFLTLIQLIRGLFIGLVVGLLALALLLGGTARIKLIQFGTILVFIIVAVSAITSIGGESSMSSMEQRFVSIVLPDASSSHAAATRQLRVDFIFGIYQDVATDGSQFLGRGLGFSPVEQPLDAFESDAMGHSFVGWLIRNSGMLGLGLYLLFIGVFFHSGLRVLRHVSQPKDRATVIGALATVAALLVASLGGNLVFDAGYGATLFALLLAIPTAIGTRYEGAVQSVQHPLSVRRLRAVSTERQP